MHLTTQAQVEAVMLGTTRKMIREVRSADRHPRVVRSKRTRWPMMASAMRHIVEWRSAKR